MALQEIFHSNAHTYKKNLFLEEKNLKKRKQTFLKDNTDKKN